MQYTVVFFQMFSCDLTHNKQTAECRTTFNSQATLKCELIESISRDRTLFATVFTDCSLHCGDNVGRRRRFFVFLGMYSASKRRF